MLIFAGSRGLVKVFNLDGVFLHKKLVSECLSRGCSSSQVRGYFVRILKEERCMRFRQYSFLQRKETCFG